VSNKNINLTEYIDENFGANASYVQGLLARYQKDPRSVDESWQVFFDDLLGSNGQPAAETRTESQSKPAATPESKVAAVSTVENARPITGPAKKIVENMEQSLTVPTATSVRSMPVKLLEENRRHGIDPLWPHADLHVSMPHLWSMYRQDFQFLAR